MEIIKFCDKDIIASYYKIDLEKYGSWLPYDPDFCIFSPEETILEPGYIVEYLYIVLSGDAYVCAPGDDGNELLHIFCREGDIYGRSLLFPGEKSERVRLHEDPHKSLPKADTC